MIRIAQIIFGLGFLLFVYVMLIQPVFPSLPQL